MNAHTKRLARLGVVAVALAVALSAAAPTVTLAQQDNTLELTQSVDQQTVAPGGTATVQATIDATGYNAPTVQASLPDGWSIQSQSADGPATFKPSTDEWIWLSGGEYTLVYTVAVPDGASGDYAIAVDGSAIDQSDDSFVEDDASSTVTVQTQPQNQPPVADPGDDQTVDEGAAVDLDASGSSDPDGDGLSYTWTQAGGPDVSLDDAGTAQPSFTAPDVDGDETLTFQLEVTDGQAADTATVDVTVQDSDDEQEPAGLSVTQTAGSAAAEPGGPVTFQTTVSASGTNGPALGVDLPAGWTIQSQSADGPATFKPATNEWVWAASGGTYTVTYTVAVPGGASDGDYTVTASGSAVDQATDTTVTDSDETTVAVAADQPAPELSTSVSLAPLSAETAPDDTTTYDLVVDDAQDGVGAYTATVSLADSSVASITDVTLHGDPPGQTMAVDIADDGSSATITAALMDTADTGSVMIASVTVEGAAAGSTTLSTSVDALANEDASRYTVTQTNSVLVTVTEVTVGNFDNPAGDTDGDGQYEDITGDDEFDIVDVQALFANLDDDAVVDNPGKFDFNDDGAVTVADVQALYAELVG